MATPRGSGAPLKLHQRCELTSYGQGEILFVGQTSFSPGLWVGIALDEPIGKHDGVVQGKRYFTATPGHGIFVRSSQLKVIDDSGDAFQDHTYLSEGEIAPLGSPAESSRQSSFAPSRTSSRLAPSPIKPNATRPSSAMPPPAVASTSAALRSKTGSPVKPSTVTSKLSVNRSPVKTPAGSAPMSRVGTASGRVSVASRPASNLGRPNTTSPLARTPLPRTATSTSTSSRTPAAANLPPSAARKAVQAAKAPDAPTARAGLRPIAKSRPSMAPPSSARQTSPTRPSRTPTAAISSRPGVTPSTTASRSAVQQSLSARTPLTSRSHTPASIAASRRGSNIDDDEGEDLLALDLEDQGLDHDLPSSSDTSAEHHSLAQQQEEGLVSPSLRKSAMSLRPDYMSLSSGPSLTALNRNTGEMAAMQRELDELRVKLKTAEKKREEDRERLREAERNEMDHEQFMAVRPKMQAKQQELQDQIKELHRKEKEWLAQREDLERQLSEAHDNLESTTLDRELAEEGKEDTTEQLRIMKDRVEELEVDLETLREQNALYESGPVDDNDKLSVGYIQLEKQNERLKDALIRLRDVMAELEMASKKEISLLERRIEELDDLQTSYESVCAKLETSDALLEDLKIQLDDALGAEEMLEQLTERNMSLSDRIEGLKLAVEELESLRELNEELEETHVETEKQLQEEIDLKDLQLRGHQMRVDTLEANIVDYEGTFAQFRELVLNLQTELEAARNDDRAQDTSRGEEDQAMLNLNLKLQSSTLKSQAKTIELELGKLQARQARENLDMISPYLPREFFENDKDACDSFLFFQRVAAKTDLIKTIVEGNHDIAGSLVGVVDESLIKVCKMRHSLAHFVVFSRQISAVIRLSTIPTFLKAGRMYKELTSMERRIDYYIDQLREEALNEEECGKEFNRFVKLLEDFDYALVDQASENLYSDLAAKEVGSAILLDLDLDTIAAALGFSKQNVATLYKDLSQHTAAEGEEELTSLRFSEREINDSLFQPLQDLINSIRATKVPTRKLLRRLSNLYDNSEAVKMEAIVKLPGLGKLTSQLVEFSSMLVNSFGVYSNECRISKTPMELKVLLTFVQEATSEALGMVPGDTPWKMTHTESSRLSQTVSELLGAATEQENVMKITGAFPWLGRVEEIKRLQSENHETQRIIVKQTEDLKDLYKQTKIRDELIQENNIKIERLGKQLQKSKEELNAVGVLKSDLSEMTKRMKAYEEGNSALQGELEQLQREYERVVQEGAAKGTDVKSEAVGGPEGGTGSTLSVLGYSRNAAISSSSLEVSYLVDQLEALRGALKHCRMENNMLKSRDVLGRLESLSPLSVPSRAEPETEDEESIPPNRGLPKPQKEMKLNENVAAEGRRLIKEFMALASSPRVVTLAPLSQASSTDGKQHRGRQWRPLSTQPQSQYLEQIKQKTRIQQQIQSLQDKIGQTRMMTLQV